jgi:hypothetical protein
MRSPPMRSCLGPGCMWGQAAAPVPLCSAFPSLPSQTSAFVPLWDIVTRCCPKGPREWDRCLEDPKPQPQNPGPLNRTGAIARHGHRGTGRAAQLII